MGLPTTNIIHRSFFKFLNPVFVLVSVSLLAAGCASLGTDAHIKDPTAKGPISETIRNNKSHLNQCIPQSISLNGGETLELVLIFNILPSGKVQNAEIEKISAPDPDFAECIVKKMNRMQFPKPSDQNTHKIRYPLIFEQAAG